MRLAGRAVAFQGGKPVDAFSVAAELLGDLPMTSGQLAQLRAVNHRYWQEVYTLLHPAGEGAPDANPWAEGAPAGASALSERDTAALRAMLEREVAAMLTPEQRATLGRTGAG
jgi:hypothetical protein